MKKSFYYVDKLFRNKRVNLDEMTYLRAKCFILEHENLQFFSAFHFVLLLTLRIEYIGYPSHTRTIFLKSVLVEVHIKKNYFNFVRDVEYEKTFESYFSVTSIKSPFLIMLPRVFIDVIIRIRCIHSNICNIEGFMKL